MAFAADTFEGLMILSPTHRWGDWLEAAGAKENMVSFTFVRDVVCPQLRKEGFAVPARLSLVGTLEAGLTNLPTRMSCGHMRTYCSFAHVLNLFWMPLIEYMDACTSEPAPVWTKNLALNHTALLAEMAGIVMGADEPLGMDKWIEFIQDTLCRLLKVDVPSRLILKVMSPMVPFYVAPTAANALHLLRSGWCSKVVGPALAAQTNRLLLAEIADVPVQLQSAEALNLSVTQDLIATLENLHCGPQVHETQDNTPAKKGEETLRVSWRACMRRLHRSCSC